jgi:hypothetical protein
MKFFDSERIRSAAAERCAGLAAELRKVVAGKPRNGNIRVIHSLDLSIAEQIASFVADAGGAARPTGGWMFADRPQTQSLATADSLPLKLFQALRCGDVPD